MARMITLTGNGAGQLVDPSAQPGIKYTILVVSKAAADFGFSAGLSQFVTLTAGVVHRIEGVELSSCYINCGASPNNCFVFVL